MIGKRNNPALCWNGGENFRDWERARKENLTTETSLTCYHLLSHTPLSSHQNVINYPHFPTQKALEIQTGGGV